MREVIIFSEDDIVNMLRGEEITLRDGSHQHTFVAENTTSLYMNAKNTLDLYKDSSAIDHLLQGKKTPNQIRELAGLEPVKELDNAYYRWNYEYTPGIPLLSSTLALLDTFQGLGLRVFNDETLNVNGNKYWYVICNSLIEFKLVNCIYILWSKKDEKHEEAMVESD